jgi:hypothetical protein
MTDQELRDLVANLAKSQAKTDRQIAETSREIKRVNKQIGELGNKFGSFTEGMAWASLDKILRQHFGMNVVGPQKAAQNGRTLQVDVLAFDTENRNEAFVVEVKSRLDQDGIDQILQTIADLPDFFPHLRGRKIYGMIAAVSIPDDLRRKVLIEGLYLAQISDETFQLSVPGDFKPKVFGSEPKQNGRADGRPKKKKLRK